MKTSLKKIGIILGIIFIIAVCCSCSKDDVQDDIEGYNFTEKSFKVNNMSVVSNQTIYIYNQTQLQIYSILRQKNPTAIVADLTIEDPDAPAGSQRAVFTNYWVEGVPVITPEGGFTYQHNIAFLQYGKRYLFHIVYYGPNRSNLFQLDFYLIRN